MDILDILAGRERPWHIGVKGVPVWRRGARKATGKTTGGTRNCQMEGCNGIRIGVRWPDGHMTWPCSKGMVMDHHNEWRIQ
jgi:hypothetical protein